MTDKTSIENSSSAIESNENIIIQPQKESYSKESYWANVIKHFKKNKLAVYSWRFILFLVIISVLADFIANEKPIIAGYKGTTYLPVFKSFAVDMGFADWQKDFQNADWKEIQFDWAIWPLIPYLPKNIDYDNAQHVGPFDEQDVKSLMWRHWLGTDELGHDVMAGMIYGTRISLLVGLLSMSIASILGILIGSLAGYFGDDRLKVSRIRVILNSIAVFFAVFYAFGARSYILGDAISDSYGYFFLELFISIIIFSSILLFANLLCIPLKKIGFLGKKLNIPVDIIISRLIEVMLSIPILFLIISIIAIAKPSIFLVMAVIGLTRWTGIARFIRGELLKVRQLEYIEAAQAFGYSESRIIFKHAVPNALAPVLITIAFGIASAILTESMLSFLGIGVPAETITWGSLLSAARKEATAWWLAIFPGFAIFITVTVYNLVGEGLTDAMDPRLRK